MAWRSFRAESGVEEDEGVAWETPLSEKCEVSTDSETDDILTKIVSLTNTLVIKEEAQESVCVDAPKVDTPSITPASRLVDLEDFSYRDRG